MALYTEKEICEDCIHAYLYECGNCLKACMVVASDERDFVRGTCPMKALAEEEEKDGNKK